MNCLAKKNFGGLSPRNYLRPLHCQKSYSENSTSFPVKRHRPFIPIAESVRLWYASERAEPPISPTGTDVDLLTSIRFSRVSRSPISPLSLVLNLLKFTVAAWVS